MSEYSASDTELEMYPDGSPSQTNLSSSLMLYTLLPSLVQRRLPKLRSLRRISSRHDRPSRRSRSSSPASTGSLTPPPSYRSGGDSLELFGDAAPSYTALSRENYASRPSSSGSTTPASVEESRSGVQWRYADPGFALLSLAQSEAKTASTSSNLIRRQYVDGVACMLRGLPSTLTKEEHLILCEALPASLKPPESAGRELTLPVSPRVSASAPHRSAKHVSVLQQGVSAVTLYLFLAIAFLLPYLQLLVRQAYQFDRKHKISDRMVAQGILAADTMSRRTMTMASQLCAMHDGKVGEFARDLGIYMMQGFGGGVYDGIGEGMQVLGLRANHDGTLQRRDARLQVVGELGRADTSAGLR